MKIGYLGAGTWGFALIDLLAKQGHDLTVWTRREDFAKALEKERRHPKLQDTSLGRNVTFTTSLPKALDGAQILIESVTARGIREVLLEMGKHLAACVNIVLTSKGIEQGTLQLLPEVLEEVLGPSHRSSIGCLSGPSHAEEVVAGLPTSVVASAYASSLIDTIIQLFTTPVFRVYPTYDLLGVCLGGAMKNIIAIACGISDVLNGINAKAALMTRGLHEMRKLAEMKGGEPETLNGLSGMGDLCVSCLSTLSRNYQFGGFLAEGKCFGEAQEAVGMVVEGAYTCVAAFELAKKGSIPVPITEAVYEVMYEGLHPEIAVKRLLTRTVKEERL